MKTIGLLYSKSTAFTAEVGARIAEAWGEGIEYVDIDTARLEDVQRHGALILGTPTAWSEFLPEVEDADFTGKKVAIYGPGDQVGSPMSFADGVGILAEFFEALGAEIVGHTSLEGYSYEQSLAAREGSFLGLILDPTNQPELTDRRLSAWIKELKRELA